MKLQSLAVTAILAVLWAVPATAAEAPGQTMAKDSTTQTVPGKAVAEGPAIELPELSHEFDQVVDGTQVTHDFIIRNTGNGPLAINEVKTG